MKKIFVLLSTLFFSISLHASQCEVARGQADNKCDPSQLAEIKGALDAQTAFYQANSGATGTAKMTEAQIAQVNAAMSKNAVFQTECGKAIKNCSDSCEAEKAQADAQQDPAKAANAVNIAAYCTQGKPKQVADQAAQNQNSMGNALGPLLQLLTALTGLIKPSDSSSLDECAVSATNTAAMVAANTNCSTDAATASAGTTFATGDYRTAKGLVSSTNPLGTGEVGIGTGAKQELAAASTGGGSGGSSGSGGSMGGRMSGASASGAAGSKDDKILPASNFSGGGGGGKSASGSGGASGKPGAYGQITKTSLDDERIMQSAVEKAMQQRGLASEGPPGGISGALSLDNFLKVEKRIQNERNQLNEL